MLRCVIDGDDEQYQKQAEKALKMADKAIGDFNKSAWLQVAQGWLSMIKRPAQTSEEKFDDTVRDQRKGGGETNTSN